VLPGRSYVSDSSGISIIDADVAVDVIEPLEAYSPIAPITLDSLTTSELDLGKSVTYRLSLDGLADFGLLIEVLAQPLRQRTLSRSLTRRALKLSCPQRALEM
jgi:hypothetical protein